MEEKAKIKEKVLKLRKNGLTYSEIIEKVDYPLNKSTLSFWCKNIKMPKSYLIRLEKIKKENVRRARELALKSNKERREKYLEEIRKRAENVCVISNNKNVAKISLAMLYLGEGTKETNGSLTFANSNPDIIKLFLFFLRFCYKIDEKKLRCTVMCRADMNIKKLESFWSEATKIPLEKFYKTRVDPRSIGKKSKNKEYKGVCRIDYFSSDLFLEIKEIYSLICERAHSSAGRALAWHARGRGFKSHWVHNKIS